MNMALVPMMPIPTELLPLHQLTTKILRAVNAGESPQLGLQMVVHDVLTLKTDYCSIRTLQGGGSERQGKRNPPNR